MASKIIVNEIEHSSGSGTAVNMTTATIATLNTTNINTGTLQDTSHANSNGIIFPSQHIIRYGLAPLATTPSALTSAGSADLITVNVPVPAAYNQIFVRLDFNYKITGNSATTNPYAYWSIVDVTNGNSEKVKSKVKHVLPANTDEVIGHGCIHTFFPASQQSTSYTVKAVHTWGEGSVTTLGNSEADLTNPTTLLIGLTQGTPT